jgi:hypothetical protein
LRIWLRIWLWVRLWVRLRIRLWVGLRIWLRIRLGIRFIVARCYLWVDISLGLPAIIVAFIKDHTTDALLVTITV